MKRKSILPYVYMWVLTVLTYLPILVAVIYSFNANRTSGVWSGFTLKWYGEVFRDKSYGKALLNSVIIGVAAAFLSAIIAVAASLGFRKRQFKMDGVIKQLGMVPLMIPEIIMGVSYLAFFRLLRIPFGMGTLIPAHMSFCIPYIFLQIEARVANMDPSPTEAARIMGAGPVKAFMDVTLPYLSPAIISGMFLSIAMSFDDVIISMFVTGVNVNTLSLKIYSQVKTTMTPKVNAMCTLILLAMIICLVVAGVVGRKKNERGNAGMKIESRKMTKKIVALLMIMTMVATAMVSLSGCGKKETLTIYTWEAMFPQELLDGFTADTGIEINYVNFDMNETMLAKLEAADGGDYDFVIADDYIVEQAIEKGLVAELDKSKISTLENINPIYRGQYYDPEDKYTVPCGAGIMELIYRPSATGFEITGYEDLWDERLKDRVGIIANPRVVNGMVLKMDGKSFNTTDVDEIRGISPKLNELAPNIRLIKDEFINDDIVTGEIDVGFMYTAQAVTAALTDPELEIVLPKEGLGFGIMPCFVPVNAPNKDAAYKFIEYLNEPENAAAWFNFMGYYCTNKAAEEYLDPSIKDMIVIPEGADLTGMEMIENIPGEVNSVHEEVWADFVSHCE